MSTSAIKVSTVFHGTNAAYVESFRKDGPKMLLQKHLEDRRGNMRRAFCTSTEFKEAERFAIRHTPANDLNNPGVVIEFDSSAVPTKDYALVADTKTMFDEREVAFFKVSKLRMVAIWRLGDKGWVRELLGA